MIKARIGACVADRRGSVAVVAAILIAVVFGIAAFAVDLGSIYLARRKAQGAADLAALAAVANLSDANKAAHTTLSDNGYGPAPSFDVDLGTYAADPTLAPGERFQVTSSGNANAARITLRTSTPLSFAKVLTGRDSVDIRTTSTAARTEFASFAIGSRLARVKDGLLNRLLGGLLGTNLDLSVMDYDALIQSDIDLFKFMGVLATQLSLTGVTYDSLLQSDVKVADILAAMQHIESEAHGPSSRVVRALAEARRAMDGLSTKVTLGSVVDAGPYGDMLVGQEPKVAVMANALDMLTATAQMADREHQVSLALNLGIPGIVSSTLKLAVGERPQGTSWVTVGSEGASVHTAQTRLLFTATLLGGGSIASLKVPIYLEVGSATATLRALDCGFPDVSTSSARLDVTPAVVDAWIGDVSDDEFNNFSSDVDPPPASLIDAPLLKVTGRAHAAVTNLSAESVTFSYADILQSAKRTVSTEDISSSLLSSLIGDTRIRVNVTGLGLGLPNAVGGQVSAILANSLSPLDAAISSVLNAVGVGLGQADVWVSGIRCDGAVLVN